MLSDAKRVTDRTLRKLACFFCLRATNLTADELWALEYVSKEPPHSRLDDQPEYRRVVRTVVCSEPNTLRRNVQQLPMTSHDCHVIRDATQRELLAWRRGAVPPAAKDIARAALETVHEQLDPLDVLALADALEDAGTYLPHLREPGPHFKLCWAVNGVLCDQVWMVHV